MGLGRVSEKYVPHIRPPQHGGEQLPGNVGCDLRPGKSEARKTLGRAEVRRPTDHAEVMSRRRRRCSRRSLTTSESHGTIAREALLAGKHVLVQKPMSMDLSDAREPGGEMAKACERPSGVRAGMAALAPTYQAMWRRIRTVKIGRPVLARGMYGWAGPDWDPFFYEPGGGPMLGYKASPT